MNEDGSGQRKDLSFVLYSAERCGKDKTVVIALKFGTIMINLFNFLSGTLRCQKVVPIHIKKCLIVILLYKDTPILAMKIKKHNYFWSERANLLFLHIVLILYRINTIIYVSNEFYIRQHKKNINGFDDGCNGQL